MSDEIPREPSAQEPVGQVEEVLPPTAPADLEKAEQLIRQSNVAKVRGQAEIAGKLMQEAEQLAPNSPVVLEAIGDDLVSRHQFRKAKDAYSKAHKLDPTNQSLENKFAEMVLKVDLHVDPWMLQEADSGTMASGKIALILSLFIPGLGQAVLGAWGKAIAFFVMFLGGWLFVIASPGGIKGMLQYLFYAQDRGDFNPWVFGAVFVAMLGWLMAVTDAAASAKRFTPRKVEKPVPPSEYLK